MLIEVTKQDITFGVRNSTQDCMVAKAVRRALGADIFEGMGESVMVYKTLIELNDYLIKLPKAVQAKIRRFDDWKMVRPFKFNLEIPNERLEETPIRREAAEACLELA